MEIALRDLNKLGAYYTGEHFVLKSGKHSEAYINPDVALTSPVVMNYMTTLMAGPFSDEPYDIVCVGPEFGGNYLAWSVATHLGRVSGYDVKWVATAKSPNGGFIIEPDRGFEKLLLGGNSPANVLVVEDLLTTGGSVKELIDSLSLYFVNIIGVTVMVNRGGVTAEDLGVPRLDAAVNITIESDVSSRCRWCAMERPIVEDIGHGSDFKRKHPHYEGGYKTLLS